MCTPFTVWKGWLCVQLANWCKMEEKMKEVRGEGRKEGRVGRARGEGVNQPER